MNTSTMTPQAWRFAHAWAACNIDDTPLSDAALVRTTLAVQHLPPSTPQQDKLAEQFVVANYCFGRGLLDDAERLYGEIKAAGCWADAAAACEWLAALAGKFAAVGAIDAARKSSATPEDYDHLQAALLGRASMLSPKAAAYACASLDDMPGLPTHWQLNIRARLVDVAGGLEAAAEVRNRVLWRHTAEVPTLAWLSAPADDTDAAAARAWLTELRVLIDAHHRGGA